MHGPSCKIYPNMFQQFIAIIRVYCLPQKLLRQYLCYECIWITVCLVWPAVEGCEQECTAASVLAVIAHQ
jgi:hypothetical protein